MQALDKEQRWTEGKPLSKLFEDDEDAGQGELVTELRLQHIPERETFLADISVLSLYFCPSTFFFFAQKPPKSSNRTPCGPVKLIPMLLWTPTKQWMQFCVWTPASR